MSRRGEASALTAVVATTEGDSLEAQVGEVMAEEHLAPNTMPVRLSSANLQVLEHYQEFLYRMGVIARSGRRLDLSYRDTSGAFQPVLTAAERGRFNFMTDTLIRCYVKSNKRLFSCADVRLLRQDPAWSQETTRIFQTLQTYVVNKYRTDRSGSQRLNPAKWVATRGVVEEHHDLVCSLIFGVMDVVNTTCPPPSQRIHITNLLKRRKLLEAVKRFIQALHVDAAVATRRLKQALQNVLTAVELQLEDVNQRIQKGYWAACGENFEPLRTGLEKLSDTRAMVQHLCVSDRRVPANISQQLHILARVAWRQEEDKLREREGSGRAHITQQRKKYTDDVRITSSRRAFWLAAVTHLKAQLLRQLRRGRMDEKYQALLESSPKRRPDIFYQALEEGVISLGVYLAWDLKADDAFYSPELYLYDLLYYRDFATENVREYEVASGGRRQLKRSLDSAERCHPDVLALYRCDLPDQLGGRVITPLQRHREELRRFRMLLRHMEQTGHTLRHLPGSDKNPLAISPSEAQAWMAPADYLPEVKPEAWITPLTVKLHQTRAEKRDLQRQIDDYNRLVRRVEEIQAALGDFAEVSRFCRELCQDAGNLVGAISLVEHIKFIREQVPRLVRELHECVRDINAIRGNPGHGVGTFQRLLKDARVDMGYWDRVTTGAVAGDGSLDRWAECVELWRTAERHYINDSLRALEVSTDFEYIRVRAREAKQRWCAVTSYMQARLGFNPDMEKIEAAQSYLEQWHELIMRATDPKQPQAAATTTVAVTEHDEDPEVVRQTPPAEVAVVVPPGSTTRGTVTLATPLLSAVNSVGTAAVDMGRLFIGVPLLLTSLRAPAEAVPTEEVEVQAHEPVSASAPMQLLNAAMQLDMALIAARFNLQGGDARAYFTRFEGLREDDLNRLLPLLNMMAAQGLAGALPEGLCLPLSEARGDKVRKYDSGLVVIHDRGSDVVSLTFSKAQLEAQFGLARETMPCLVGRLDQHMAALPLEHLSLVPYRPSAAVSAHPVFLRAQHWHALGLSAAAMAPLFEGGRAPALKQTAGPEVQFCAAYKLSGVDAHYPPASGAGLSNQQVAQARAAALLMAQARLWDLMLAVDEAIQRLQRVLAGLQAEADISLLLEPVPGHPILGQKMEDITDLLARIEDHLADAFQMQAQFQRSIAPAWGVKLLSTAEVTQCLHSQAEVLGQLRLQSGVMSGASAASPAMTLSRMRAHVAAERRLLNYRRAVPNTVGVCASVRFASPASLVAGGTSARLATTGRVSLVDGVFSGKTFAQLQKAIRGNQAEYDRYAATYNQSGQRRAKQARLNYLLMGAAKADCMQHYCNELALRLARAEKASGPLAGQLWQAVYIWLGGLPDSVNWDDNEQGDRLLMSPALSYQVHLVAGDGQFQTEPTQLHCRSHRHGRQSGGVSAANWWGMGSCKRLPKTSALLLDYIKQVRGQVDAYVQEKQIRVGPVRAQAEIVAVAV